MTTKIKLNVNISTKNLLVAVLWMFALFCVMSCNSKNDPNSINKIIGQEVIASDSLGYIRDMVIYNGYLILLDAKPLNDENQLRIYDLNDFRFLYSTGRIGTGPGEFYQGISLNKIVYGKKGFSLIDLSSKKILIYQSDYSGKLNYYQTIELKGGRPYMPIMLDDSTIFSLGLELFSGRFALYDNLGNMVKTLGEIPPGKEKDTPIPVHHQACKGLMRITPDGKKIIISYQFADLIEIYDAEGIVLKRIGKKNGTPKYKPIVRRDGYHTFVITDETILGYLDIQVTDKYIVALFSGELASTTQYESNIIRVYTLEGDLIKTNMLDKKISKIEIDIKNNRLIGLSYFPLPIVYTFNLEKILK